MARYNQLPKYPLVPGGVTNDIPLNLISDGFIIEGTETITANNVFTTTDVPEEGNQLLTIYYKGVATYNGGVVQVFGTNLTQDEAQNKCKIECYFNGVDWDVYVTTRYSNTGYVRNAQVASDAAIAVNKLATLTANRAVQTGAGGVTEASPTTTADLAKLSAITVSAADLNRVGGTTALTADLDILTGADAAGLTPTEIQYLIGVTSNLQTQLNAKANTADFSGLVSIQTAEVTIPSAQVLTLNSTPVTLVPAQGANTIIVPMQIIGSLDYGTTPYATNGNIQIFNGGTYNVANVADDVFLFGSVPNRNVYIFLDNFNMIATDTQFVANSPLTITVETGNPTAGDSDVRIFLTYMVIQVP